MKTTYLFNPENDMALACASVYYLAPRNVRKMAADMAPLPFWYAEGGDSTVLLHDEAQLEWMRNEVPEALKKTMCVQGILNFAPDTKQVSPWGWNPALCYLLQKECAGVKMPSTMEMEKIRQLSGRKTAVELLPSLQRKGTIGESAVLHTLNEVDLFVAAHPKVLLKAPWSGSGRGILPVEGECTVAMHGWVKHVLTVQGYVVGEPFYERVADFALEFKALPGELKFVGYSMFDTDTHGAYKGNLLASNAAILKELSVYIATKEIEEICETLLTILPNYIKGIYTGYLGVDMMICRLSDGSFAIHPCVEINWRMNMGLVARFFYDRFVDDLSRGNYYTEFYASPGEALQQHKERMEAHPLLLQGGKIKSGYLSLTPVYEQTQYQAYVVIG